MKCIIMTGISILALLSLILLYQNRLKSSTITIAVADGSVKRKTIPSTDQKVTKNDNIVKNKIVWKLEENKNEYLQSRDMKVLLKSNWKSNNICERYGYYLERNTHWEYLDKLLDAEGNTKDQDEKDPLLEYSISLKAYSPLCELYNGLVNDLDIKSKSDGDVIGVLSYPQEVIFENIKQLLEWYTNFKNKKSKSEEIDKMESILGRTIDKIDVTNDNIDVTNSILIPGETIHPSISSTSNNQDSDVVVIYVKNNQSSINYLRTIWYNELKQSKIPFIIRFYNDDDDENETTDNKMLLQGYGVRLDIRNIEYRAFDDAASSSSSSSSSSSTTNNKDKHINTESILKNDNIFLAGVNISILTKRYDQKTISSSSSLEKIVETLYKQHENRQEQMSVVPHAYQRRRLSIQTTKTILKESDPLRSLQHLSQNLPSYANLLSMTSTSFDADTIHWIKIMNNVMKTLNPSSHSTVPFSFYINGLRIPIERPSFNVYELLKTIKSEMLLLDHLQSSFKDALAKELPLRSILCDMSALFTNDSYQQDDDENDEQQMAQEEDDHQDHDDDDTDASSSSTSLRIDVGRTTPYKKPIFYINNIERDVQYQQYSYSLQTLLYGSIQVRRNLFHALLIINPFQVTKNDLDLIDFIYQLVYMQGLPIRIGFLFYNDHDHDTDNDITTYHDDYVQVYQIIHLYQILSEYYSTPTLISTIKYFMEKIYDEMKNDNNASKFIKFKSKKEVWAILLKYLEKEENKQMKKNIKLSKIYDLWTDDDDDDDEARIHYFSNTIPFIRNKSLKTGTFFLNGVPISLDSKSSVEETSQMIIHDDIRFIATSMMSGLINDKKPKSLYSFLLTKRAGVTIHSSYHPLLTQVALKDKIYIYYETTTSAIPLFTTTTSSASDDSTSTSSTLMDNDIQSFYIIALYIDYNQPKHITIAKQFLNLMQKENDTLFKSSSWIGYDILPITTSSKSSASSRFNSILSCVRNQQKKEEKGIESLIHFTNLLCFINQYLINNSDDNDESNTYTIDDLLNILNQLKDEQITTTTTTTSEMESLSYWIDLLSSSSDKHDICHDDEITNAYPNYDHTNISSDPLLVVNGRVYPISSSSVEPNDIQILLSSENKKSIALSSLVLKSSSSSSSTTNVEKAKLVWKISSYFSQLFGSKYSAINDTDILQKDKKRSNVLKIIESTIDRYNKQESTTMLYNDNPLQLKWNTDDSKNNNFNPQITVILDPLTEPTQRIVPILFTLRDYFKVPFYLYFSPRLELNSEDVLPISSYYRFVAQHNKNNNFPHASFRNLPNNHVFTIQMDVPEPWDVQQSNAIQDTDNLRCVSLDDGNTSTTTSSSSSFQNKFCGDYAYSVSKLLEDDSTTENGNTITIDEKLINNDDTIVEYELKGLLFFGQCYDVKSNTMMDPPNGLQITLSKMNVSLSSSSNDNDNNGDSSSIQDTEILPDGSTATIVNKQDQSNDNISSNTASSLHYSDTLVMKNLGYWQIHANPGIWELNIAKNTKGAEMYNILSTEDYDNGSKSFMELADSTTTTMPSKKLVMKDFVHRPEFLLVKRRPEYIKGADNVLLGDVSNPIADNKNDDNDDIIHVFSLATGHLYERLLKIMMLSVTKRTSSRVKFWLFENYLSPSFKSSARHMANKIGCDIEFVTYKWPEWLRGQSEKQRIIWGYKILFLDVLFPLNVKKIIYVDADQVVRGDLKELWDYDLKGAPYGYVPFCTSRESTLGYQFWRSGFWKSHLRHKPYHISALYVVDLHLFRRTLVGDKLRQTYQQLSADPNSLANLDQDLPNFAQHDVPIHSLPQEWLWCETWCSDETKVDAKTIDLCNNPDHKENKVSMAKRIISGELFPESWTELDAEVDHYDKDHMLSFDKN